MKPSELRALATAYVPFIAPEETPFWGFAAKQYRTDASIKLLTEFAIAGAIILSFLSPPKLPEFAWPRRAASAQSTPSSPSFAASLPPFPSPTGVPLDRSLFSASSPALRPVLNRAADALKDRRGATALTLLRDADPRDPNVMLLSDMAGLATWQLGIRQ